ncbi:hypothetical protein [uncultured Duncaniella sp.]|uniref:hypothetical protein n=1 Tax=uncultured Duncaniella sp. TaxID=2768039 RepID=UPI0025E4FE58|nr:hypothetical protein [uncultured Duncaniella sp.]
MRHALLISIVTGGALMLGACGGSDSVSDQISSAELALANENVSATRELCNHILKNKGNSGMEAKQMARLSILYMQLNERSDDPEDVEYAVQCFRDAFSINADSARAYYTSLPYDQDKYAMTLSTIVHTLDNPREIPTDHDCDPNVDDTVGMDIDHVEHPDSIGE